MDSREARARYNAKAVEKAVAQGLCPRCKALPPKDNCSHCQDCITYYTEYKAKRKKKAC